MKWGELCPIAFPARQSYRDGVAANRAVRMFLLKEPTMACEKELQELAMDLMDSKKGFTIFQRK
jgi:hypothetical protein